METLTPYRFRADGKAANSRELDSGDLIIEGFAADFSGVDRQNENFTAGAFQKGIRDFLSGQAGLHYHHRHDVCLGRVLDLRELPGRGLWMRARVDHQNEASPLNWIYRAIKRGTLNSLSVGGFFNRTLTAAGWRISSVDLTEISITSVPSHPGTNFAVVAGKALTPADSLESWAGDLRDVALELAVLRAEQDLQRLQYARSRR